MATGDWTVAELTPGSSPERWAYDVGGHGWGNEERQYYTDDPANAATDGNGNLVITLGESLRQFGPPLDDPLQPGTLGPLQARQHGVHDQRTALAHQVDQQSGERFTEPDLR